MPLQWPTSVDTRAIIAVIAIIGVLLFALIFRRRAWKTIRGAQGRWARVFSSICVPIILAFVLGFAAAIIFSKLGIVTSPFQGDMFGIHFQVDGSVGAFAIVYLGSLRFLADIRSRKSAPEPDTRQTAVRATPASDWPPDPISDGER